MLKLVNLDLASRQLDAIILYVSLCFSIHKRALLNEFKPFHVMDVPCGKVNISVIDAYFLS